MRIVMHFFGDDSVESVQVTWFNNDTKLCAWPVVKNKIKRYIEKQKYPDEINFKWIPSRTLGRSYGKKLIIVIIKLISYIPISNI